MLLSSALSASGSGDFTFIQKGIREITHLSEKGEALPENANFEIPLRVSNALPENFRDVSFAQRWCAAYASPRYEKRVEQLHSGIPAYALNRSNQL